MIKEKKEEKLASGNEIVQLEDATPLQTRLNIPKMLKLVPLSSSKKRKVVSRTADMGNLPSHRDLKRAKINPSSCGKAHLIKSNPPLAENPIEVPPSFEAPSFEAPPCLNLELSKAPPMSASYTLIRSETLAWNRFKTVVNEDDVMACYDMTIKEFECSNIHDLFKVLLFVHSEL